MGGVVTTAADGRGRNEAVVFSPEGEEVACYQKIHPFTFGGEANHYAAGSEIVTFRWGAFTVCPFVCYDLRFPEVFRLAVRRGADLFAVIANWPASREHHWLTLLQARAIENQAYVVGVNRCGRGNVLAYSGRSVIIDPRGRIVADAGNGEGVVHAAVDAESLRNYREAFPALRDMRREDFPE
ncbi:MAG: nitrilase-related carbon-nitrogen hydrolase [Bacillota bacterium]